MVTRSAVRFLHTHALSLALGVMAGCSWQLPIPHVDDAATPHDASQRIDRPTLDVHSLDATVTPTDTGAQSTDLGTPTHDNGTLPIDNGTLPIDNGTPSTDRGASTTDMGVPPTDVPTLDLGVDVGWPECTPGSRRSCFTGPDSSRGHGLCRDGVQTCAPDGTWPTTPASCVGQILPDCESRTCGSDGCGDSCGGCASPEVCDQTGQCVSVTCGAANFTLNCPSVGLCPRDGACTPTGCACATGFIAKTCDGEPCPPTGCSYPDWFCQRSLFCNAGAITCAGGYLCPRYSRCVPATRGCECAQGFMAVDCMNNRCTSCPGTDYRCVPAG